MKTRLRGLARRLPARTGRSDAEASVPDGPQEPIVSLTFDDGLASHRIAAELLAARGLRGTFYVPSGLVGREGRLGWDDLRALVSQGHEIGGHTSSHSHLPALTASDARREIESDRLALLERDLNPLTFAYPFGESSPRSRQSSATSGTSPAGVSAASSKACLPRILSACAPRTVPAAGRPRSSSLHSLSSARTKPAG